MTRGTAEMFLLVAVMLVQRAKALLLVLIGIGLYLNQVWNVFSVVVTQLRPVTATAILTELVPSTARYVGSRLAPPSSEGVCRIAGGHGGGMGCTASVQHISDKGRAVEIRVIREGRQETPVKTRWCSWVSSSGWIRAGRGPDVAQRGRSGAPTACVSSGVRDIRRSI